MNFDTENAPYVAGYSVACGADSGRVIEFYNYIMHTGGLDWLGRWLGILQLHHLLLMFILSVLWLLDFFQNLCH